MSNALIVVSRWFDACRFLLFRDEFIPWYACILDDQSSIIAFCFYIRRSRVSGRISSDGDVYLDNPCRKQSISQELLRTYAQTTIAHYRNELSVEQNPSWRMNPDSFYF